MRKTTIELYAKTKRRTNRYVAGDARPADPAHPAFRPDPRPCHRQIDRADFTGCAASGSRLTLPGAAAAGAARLNQRQVGNIGEQSARQVLPLDGGRPQDADDRDQYMGTLELGDR